jgi:hypothetical protein
LQREQQPRIDADHQLGTGQRQPPTVVAIAAADIEHTTAHQRVDGTLDARPLQLAAPLAVDLDAKQIERPLAPGMQRQQATA